jgi:type III restriction enzyme
MPDPALVNPTALEPLFAPWEEPTKHRVKADKPGEPAKIIHGRRPSPIVVANNLCGRIKPWRETPNAGSRITFPLPIKPHSYRVLQGR